MPLADLNINVSALIPQIGVAVLAVVVMVIDFFTGRTRNNSAIAVVSILGLIGLLPMAYIYGDPDPAFGGMLAADAFSSFFNVVFILAAIFTVFISMEYLQRMGMHKGEYYYITLFATLGMMVMAASNDLLSLYVGLELMALSFYVLVAMKSLGSRPIEGAVKYFVQGALSSGILLYGISFTYGIAGSTNLVEIAANLKGVEVTSPFLLLGITMTIAGFAFKIAAFPFHVWAPDTYEGAPTPVTAFLSVGSKAAAFAVFLRVFTVAFPAFQPEWSMILWVLAVATMLYGSVAAISQRDIIRMLAYSSITHAGIILIGILTHNDIGLAGVMYYLLVYVFMNMGCFAVVAFLVRKNGRWENISDYKGLAYKSPLTAFLLALFLVSLAGIPPTGGFLAKFYIFASAVSAKYYWLAGIGILATVISLFFYARIIFYMYMKEPELDAAAVPARGLANDLALLFAAVGTIFLGIYPEPFINMAMEAVKSILA